MLMLALTASGPPLGVTAGHDPNDPATPVPMGPPIHDSSSPANSSLLSWEAVCALMVERAFLFFCKQGTWGSAHEDSSGPEPGAVWQPGAHMLSGGPVGPLCREPWQPGHTEAAGWTLRPSSWGGGYTPGPSQGWDRPAVPGQHLRAANGFYVVPRRATQCHCNAPCDAHWVPWPPGDAFCQGPSELGADRAQSR